MMGDLNMGYHGIFTQHYVMDMMGDTVHTEGTDPVVCPNCNIEDSLSSNMRRDIAENTAYTECFLLSDSAFPEFYGLGF